MSAEKRVNIGMIGAGWWAHTMHMPALATCDQANVVAVCDLIPERAETLAKKYHIPHTFTDYNAGEDIMNFNKIRGPCVGADLSCPSPIYRPPETHPHVPSKKLKFIMNLRKLDHVSFLVKDVERSRRFYGQVLGLRELPRPSNVDNPGAWLTNDEHSFEVHLIGEAEAGRVAQTHTQYRCDELARGYGSHPAFEVENLEALIQHLRALNVEIVGGPHPRGDGVQQIFICDPDGYMIELFVWEAR